MSRAADLGETAPQGRRPAISRLGAERRRQVLAEGARLFDAVGYHSTSIEDLAAACGIRKATLYHYFKSKREILFWIQNEFIDLLAERQRARADADLSAHQALLEVMCGTLELIDSHRSYFRVFFEYQRELEDEDRETIQRKHRDYDAAIEEMFTRGIQSGEFRELDPRSAALVLTGMCNWAYHWYRPAQTWTAREIAESFWEILTSGFERRPLPEAEGERPSG